MTVFKEFKLDEVDTIVMLQDIEYQFEVSLKIHRENFPNIYLVQNKNGQSIAVLSKNHITPIGLAYKLSEDDNKDLHLF